MLSADTDLVHPDSVLVDSWLHSWHTRSALNEICLPVALPVIASDSELVSVVPLRDFRFEPGDGAYKWPNLT